MKTLKHAWQVFWRCRKMTLMRFLSYHKDAYIWSIISIFWTFFNILYLYLMVRPKGNLGGWSLDEIFLLQGVFAMIDSFTWSFFYQNMRLLTNEIFDGQLSVHLLKPINPQFFLMTRYNNYNNVFRFMIGLGLFIHSVINLKLAITLGSLLLFLAVALIGLFTIYLLWFGIATFNFWTDRLNNINDIMPSMRDFWLVPRNVYSGLIGLIVTSIIPIALIVSVPSEIILGQIDWRAIARLALFASILFVITRKFFYFSLQKYSSVGQ